MSAGDRIAATLRVLTRECQAVEAFVLLLETERTALAARDHEALASLTPRKLEAASALASLASERNESVSSAGFPAARGGVRAFVAAHPQAKALWQRLQTLGAQARTSNRTVGHLLESGLASAGRALAILRQGAQAPLYAPNGEPAALRAARERSPPPERNAVLPKPATCRFFVVRRHGGISDAADSFHARTSGCFIKTLAKGVERSIRSFARESQNPGVRTAGRQLRRNAGLFQQPCDDAED